MDICKAKGINKTGTAWFDHLYLNFAILSFGLIPIGKIEILNKWNDFKAKIRLN